MVLFHRYLRGCGGKVARKFAGEDSQRNRSPRTGSYFAVSNPSAARQTRMKPEPAPAEHPTASELPSGEKAMLMHRSGSANVASSWPVATFQSFTFRSPLAVAKVLLSGENAAAFTPWMWPFRIRRRLPEGRSHKYVSLDWRVVTARCSAFGEKHTDSSTVSGPPWSPDITRLFPGATSHTTTRLLSPHAAIHRPSSENLSPRMVPSIPSMGLRNRPVHGSHSLNSPVVLPLARSFISAVRATAFAEFS